MTKPFAEKIRNAYNRALAILNPDAKTLSHGLELHKQSLVFDAYGFAPFSAVDEEAIRRATDEGACSRELQDLREELIMTRHLHDSESHKEYEAAWNASGVTCVFQNSGEEGQSPTQMLKRLARFTHCTDNLRGFLRRATDPADIESAKADELHCLYMTTNGIPLAQQWQSVDEELGYIRIFAQLGCRMMHMTYNRRNMIGDGCMEESNAGLSDFGRVAVREMNRTGVICDVAHSGEQTSLEVAKCSYRPVVSSHSCCSGLFPHRRAKSDKVIKAIADSGGYNGICCVSGFLGGSSDISSFLDQIDYMIRTFGENHVAIGTDNAYVSVRTEDEARLAGALVRSLPRFESFWQPGSIPPPNDESLCWTNWPLFTVGLVQRGHSDDVIRKVIGGNALRVAHDAVKGL